MFDEFFDVSWFYIDDRGWPKKISEIPDHKNQAGIIWFVGFKHLVHKFKKSFDWGRYSGHRIMYDLDAYQNYSTFASSKYYGMWPKIFRLHRFDVLVCTGKATFDLLMADGVNAQWIPKAFGENLFYDKGRKRRNLCYFGRMYFDRKRMLEFLTTNSVLIDKIRCSFFLLNSYLNQHKACVVYNGPEPMQKQFEVAASGCVPICNELPELVDLGFRDGKTMISYNSFDELLEKLYYYLKHKDLLVSIGKAAAKLSVDRHTWSHRAELFRRLLCSM